MNPGTQQVFADPHGRRRIILLPLAIGAGCLLGGFALVVAAGFAGGPAVPFLQVPQVQPGTASHGGGSSQQAAEPARPAASASPTPAASALTGQPKPASSPSATGGTSAGLANRAGKTPPGRARAASPAPRGTRP
jgi:hypothetical protein